MPLKNTLKVIKYTIKNIDNSMDLVVYTIDIIISFENKCKCNTKTKRF